MENRNNSGAIVAVSLFLTLMLCAIVHDTRSRKNLENPVSQKPTESVYDFVKLSDSSFHLNLSDSSCLFAEVSDDTLYLKGTNTDVIVYDRQTHELRVGCRCSNGFVSETAFDLDTVLSNIPSNVIF